MPVHLKLLAAFALIPALAACGSPADDSDEPLAGSTSAPSNAMESAGAGAGDAQPSQDTASGELGEMGEAGDASQSQTPSATGSVAGATPSPSATTAAATAPPMFAVCGACHAVEPGRHGLGPSLAGVFNAPAASKAGFDYSEAMESSGITWNESTLDRYLENPQGVIPGTSMAYNGLKNAEQRQAVVAYLRGL